MINICPEYDVVLTYSPIVEITGHIFECFDYYLFLRQFCKVGILFFCGLDIEKLRICFESKYTEGFDRVKEDIIQVNCVSCASKKKIIQFGKNTAVVLADGNIKSLEYNNIVLATSRLYGFMCEDEHFEEQTLNKHITYLQDYRIYGRNRFFKSVNYVKKIPFKFYRKFSPPGENVGMMYMTYVCRKVSPDIIREYHLKSGCSRTILVVPYRLPEYDGIDGVAQIEAPVHDIFEKFDTYIYTPINRKFDCSPRLVTECFMLGRNIFKDLDYYDTGLETRYSDCVNNLNSLDLTDSDEILKILFQRS